MPLDPLSKTILTWLLVVELGVCLGFLGIVVWSFVRPVVYPQD